MLGVHPATPCFYELFAVREHLKIVATCFDRLDDIDARGEPFYSKKYDLYSKANEFVATLSKGMKQRWLPRQKVSCPDMRFDNLPSLPTQATSSGGLV
ncbi:MAG: hypothetical protein ACR2HJ_06135 [Fimbriimonadales bacterium]